VAPISSRERQPCCGTISPTGHRIRAKEGDLEKIKAHLFGLLILVLGVILVAIAFVLIAIGFAYRFILRVGRGLRGRLQN
ncbi:MAG: hypothetical protein U1B77_01050, partial [Dehalococcoidales bacterium]|nr:hypothetical protein [Dehalococcoidales bacterium]